MAKKRNELPAMIPRKAFGMSRNSLYILADLFRAKRPLSVKRVAERNNISWKTADNNVKKLEKRGLVKCKRSKRRTYCEIAKEVRKVIKLSVLFLI